MPVGSRKVGVLVSVRARLPSNAVAGFPGDSLASLGPAFVVPSPSTYEGGTLLLSGGVGLGVSVCIVRDNSHRRVPG